MTHRAGRTVWLTTDAIVRAMKASSFRAGVISTYESMWLTSSLMADRADRDRMGSIGSPCDHSRCCGERQLAQNTPHLPFRHYRQRQPLIGASNFEVVLYGPVTWRYVDAANDKLRSACA